MIRELGLMLCSLPALLGASQFLVTQPGEILTARQPVISTTPLVFAYVTTRAGFDTAITISNTSPDTRGSS